MQSIQESFSHYNHIYHFHVDFKSPGSGIFLEENEKDQFNLRWLNLAVSRLSWERRTVERLFLDSKNMTRTSSTHTTIIKSDEDIGNKRMTTNKLSASLATEECLTIIPKGAWRQGMVISRCAVSLPTVKSMRGPTKRDESGQVYEDHSDDVCVDTSFETYVQMLITMASYNNCDVVVPMAASIDSEATDIESKNKTNRSDHPSSKKSFYDVSSPSVRNLNSNKSNCWEMKNEKEWEGVFVISPIPRSSSVAVAEISYISYGDERIDGDEEGFLDQFNGSQSNQIGVDHAVSEKYDDKRDRRKSAKLEEKLSQTAEDDDSYVEITVRVVSIIDIFKFCLPVDGNDEETVKSQRISLRKVARDLLLVADPRSSASNSIPKGLNSIKEVILFFSLNMENFSYSNKFF